MFLFVKLLEKTNEKKNELCILDDTWITFFIIFLRGHGNESCNVIGSLPSQYFPISAHEQR